CVDSLRNQFPEVLSFNDTVLDTLKKSANQYGGLDHGRLKEGSEITSRYNNILSCPDSFTSRQVAEALMKLPGWSLHEAPRSFRSYYYYNDRILNLMCQLFKDLDAKVDLSIESSRVNGLAGKFDLAHAIEVVASDRTLTKKEVEKFKKNISASLYLKSDDRQQPPVPLSIDETVPMSFIDREEAFEKLKNEYSESQRPMRDILNELCEIIRLLQRDEYMCVFHSAVQGHWDKLQAQLYSAGYRKCDSSMEVYLMKKDLKEQLVKRLREWSDQPKGNNR
ncbi:MAG: hypothetical protein WBQ73_02475, partial [Candidatus Babeliales bacterium]